MLKWKLWMNITLNTILSFMFMLHLCLKSTEVYLMGDYIKFYNKKDLTFFLFESAQWLLLFS